MGMGIGYCVLFLFFLLVLRCCFVLWLGSGSLTPLILGGFGGVEGPVYISAAMNFEVRILF